jgi:CheY-like chemotaxis protein
MSEDRDLSRSQLEQALAEALARCEEAERRSEAAASLVAHLSHEVRTPLNGVLGLTELALRAATAPSQKRHLEMALQSGHDLLHLVNDLLDWSRLDAGKLQLADEAFNLPETLAIVFRTVMPQMRSKGLIVRYDHVGPVSWVRGDASRLRQIVMNLLGNAVKFTQRGEVALLCETMALGDGRCLATIKVQDSGPGIAPELLDKLFTPYVQGEHSHRGHGGAGLGLSICRGLARAMGGDITAESVVGQGSCFTVALPMVIEDDPDPVPEPPPGHAWLVFPQAQIAGWVQGRLQRLQWSSEAKPSVEAVIADAQHTAELPQLLLISERAVAAGVDFPALRAALPRTRIHLVMRPDWNEPVLEQAAQAHQVHFTLSPFTPRDLSAMASAAAKQCPPGAARRPAVPWTNALRGDVLIVEDNPVNQIIDAEFLKALGLPTRVADNGEEALKACLEQAPQLVLMDVQMPVMDGRQACRKLRELQHAGSLPDFPIVALTAHAMSIEREQCLAAGMDGYLSKPLALGALREALSRWLPEIAPADAV